VIRPAEIQQIARREGVRDTQIEKDYALSWILTSIAHSTLLSEILAFKGGTVLKKFYFEDYRHSEDLDFTLLDSMKTNDDIRTAFETAFDFVKEEANISLNIIEFGEYETGNINFYIAYDGPLGGAGKKVKVDISKNKLLQFPLETKPLFSTYSDHIDSLVKCYSLSEVMTEKMRSLLSRQQPRDFYVWYLSEYEGLEMSNYIAEYELKAKHKGLNPDNLQSRIEKITPVFKSRWAGSMNEQIKELPPFEQVARELGRHFRKLIE
jgi:predicted nucleotidyltransferase component of viral defense system